MENLLAFLKHLEASHTNYRLESNRDAVMVIVRTPSAVHEVDFFSDGQIEMETLNSAGNVKNVTLADLIALADFTT